MSYYVRDRHGHREGPYDTEAAAREYAALWDGDCSDAAPHVVETETSVLRAERDAALAEVERPILFSAPMVRAILTGQKTQTRRIVKTVPSCHDADIAVPALMVRRGQHRGSYVVLDDELGPAWSPAGATPYEPYPWPEMLSPYGEPGDRLWVRETWGHTGRLAGIPSRGEADVFYAADGLHAARWYPAIYMPRWASRITLDVTAVRVERLHAITEQDARDEGVTRDGLVTDGRPYRTAFSRLWDEINYSRAPWVGNPWCWVISFRQLRRPSGQGAKKETTK